MAIVYMILYLCFSCSEGAVFFDSLGFTLYDIITHLTMKISVILENILCYRGAQGGIDILHEDRLLAKGFVEPLFE